MFLLDCAGTWRKTLLLFFPADIVSVIVLFGDYGIYKLLDELFNKKKVHILIANTSITRILIWPRNTRHARRRAFSQESVLRHFNKHFVRMKEVGCTRKHWHYLNFFEFFTVVQQHKHGHFIEFNSLFT